MQPIRSVSALNSFVALEPRSIHQYIHDLEGDCRPQTWVRLRNKLLQSSSSMVWQAQLAMGPTLSQGFGTGRLTPPAECPAGHVANPGVNPGFNGSQAALQGGLFSSLITFVCLPWLPALGIGALSAGTVLGVAGAGIALTLHHAQAHGHRLFWLEDAAGLMTAVGRGSLTAYAGVLGTLYGIVAFVAAQLQQSGNFRPQ